jgi:hypothetical protein
MSRSPREDRDRERRQRDRERGRRRAHHDEPSTGSSSSAAALSSVVNGIVVHPLRGLIATATTILTELTTRGDAPTLAIVSAAAFFIGRWTANRGFGSKRRRKEGEVDTIEELLKQPYMRDVGSPATSNGSVGGMLGNVRRAVIGKSQRERDDERIAAIDAQMRSETMSTELAMMDAGFGATSPDVRALIDSVDTRMLMLHTEMSIERSGAGYDDVNGGDFGGVGGDSTPTSKLVET